MKLHLDCGNNKKKGYINCDISPSVKPDKFSIIIDLFKKNIPNRYYKIFRKFVKKYQLRNFDRSLFVKIYLNNLDFWILIDPANGELDEFLFINKKKLYESDIIQTSVGRF